MKKQFSVEGMSCGHCRMAVERALNSIEGVRATVTLEPPVAIVEFDGDEIPFDDLQFAVAQAGDFRLLEM